MKLTLREHKIEFETSKSLQEITAVLEEKVDFKCRDYKSSISLAKDFYGSIEGAEIFSFKMRPFIIGILDLSIREMTDPRVNMKVQENRIYIRIKDPGIIFQYIISTVVILLFIPWSISFLPDNYTKEDIEILAIGMVAILCFINLSLFFKYRLLIHAVKKKIIKEL